MAALSSKCQAALGLAGAPRRAQLESCLGIKLGQHHGGHVVDQPVQVGAAAVGQGPQALVLVIGQSNDECAHRSDPCCRKSSGLTQRRPGNHQFDTREVTQGARDDKSGTARNCQLDQVVVGLVRQVGAPPEVEACPLAGGQKDVQPVAALMG